MIERIEDKKLIKYHPRFDGEILKAFKNKDFVSRAYLMSGKWKKEIKGGDLAYGRMKLRQMIGVKETSDDSKAS